MTKKKALSGIIAGMLSVMPLANVSPVSYYAPTFAAENSEITTAEYSDILTTTAVTSSRSTTAITTTTVAVSERKPLISENDIIRLSEKGDALTWSDFEEFEYTDIGSGLYIWKFNIQGGGELQISGGHIYEKPDCIEFISGGGVRVDIRTEDMTLWFCDGVETTTAVTSTANTITTTTTAAVSEHKPLISEDDIIRLSEKGDALTWSDFEEFEYTDIGSGLYIWKFNIQGGGELQISGGHIYEKPDRIVFLHGNGAEVDIRTEDMTLWFCDGVETTTAVTSTANTITTTTTAAVSEHKPLISEDDIIRLSEKGEALTWSDFEEFEYTDIGSGLYIWEFSMQNNHAKLQISGADISEKPARIEYLHGGGVRVDIRTEDMTLWFCNSSQPPTVKIPAADINLEEICNNLRKFAAEQNAVYVSEKDGIVVFGSDKQEELDMAKAYCIENKIDSKYVFFVLIEEEMPVEIINGDANCDGNVNLADAVLVLQAFSNPDVYGVSGTNENHITELGMTNADVYEVGTGITPQDALAIQKYTLKLVSELPE